MFALQDFYDGIGKEMARRQMAEEARQHEQPPRPSWIARLLSKLADRPSASQALMLNQHDELRLDSPECK